MFQYQKEDLNFELAFNSFRDEVLHKSMLIETLTFQFQKLTNQPNLSKSTVECIKFSRRVIDEVQGILQSIKIYLIELKQESFYELLMKTFRILIISFNLLSSKFMDTLRMKKIPIIQEELNRSSQKNESQPKSKNKSQFRQMEYFDFLIKNLEQQEQKINLKKKNMEIQLMKEKLSINLMSPSQTVNQLEILNKDLQRIISNSQKIAGENVLFRYQELSKRILLLKKPEEINSQFCSKISSNVKDKFISTLERIIKQFYMEIKQKEKEKIILQILGSKPTLIESSAQTDWDGKSRQVDQLTKEKKMLQNQLQSLKKSNSLLQNEIEKTIEKYKSSKETIRYLERRNQDLDHLVKRKTAEINSQKAEHQKKYQQLLTLHKKQSEQVQRFSKTDTFVQQAEKIKENITPITPDSQNSNTLQDSLRTSKCKALRQKSANSFFYDRENLAQRKQNYILRNSLQKVINKLNQSQLITFTDIDKDLKLGNLTQKIDEIISSLPSKPAENQSSQPLKNDQLAEIFTKVNSVSEIQCIDFGTQTDHRVFINQPSSNRSAQKQNYAQAKKSKLELLKIQFLEKLKKKKQQGLFQNKYRIKQNNQFTHHFDHVNQTMENQYHEQIFEEPQVFSIEKPKQQIFRKDISFEDFKIAKNKKKPPQIDRRIGSRGKKHETMKTEHSKEKVLFQQRFAKESIMQSQNEIHKQLKPIMAKIEANNDNKDLYLNNFIKGLFDGFEKMKGKLFLQNLLAKQLSKIAVKPLKTQIKLNKPKKNQELLF